MKRYALGETVPYAPDPKPIRADRLDSGDEFVYAGTLYVALSVRVHNPSVICVAIDGSLNVQRFIWRRWSVIR